MNSPNGHYRHELLGQLLTGDPSATHSALLAGVPLLVQVQDALSGNQLWNEARTQIREPEHHQRVWDEVRELAVSLSKGQHWPSPEQLSLTVDLVVCDIFGLGPLEPLWDDNSIGEIMVNGPFDVRIERAGKIVCATGAVFRDDEHVAAVAERILWPLNRRNDVRDTLTDARLPDGSRVNITHACLSPIGTTITIRRFPESTFTLQQLLNVGALNHNMATHLAKLATHRASILVIGGSGSGKTSMLNALSDEIPANERIVSIEDSVELQLNPDSHWIPLESRPADTQGENAVTIRQLVKNALRMRPDRIIVGEVRDGAALDMLTAMSTGHEGSMSTLHANGPNEALDRLSILVTTAANLPENKIARLMASALDVIVECDRFEDGTRKVTGIYELPTIDHVLAGQPLIAHPIWKWRTTGVSGEGTIEGSHIQEGEWSHRLKTQCLLDSSNHGARPSTLQNTDG